jgi:hypothetical protein
MGVDATNVVQTGQWLQPVTEASTTLGLSRMEEMANMLQRRTCQNKEEPHPFEVGYELWCSALDEPSRESCRLFVGGVVG